MAILKDFIDQVTFIEVWALLGQNRLGMAEYKDSFQSIFNELKATVPAENKNHMSIHFVMEEAPMWDFYFGDDEDTQEDEQESDAPTLQVYGFIPGDDEGYAIGLKSPDILVGLTVDEETVSNYSPAEIVAHCMEEMTYSSTMASSAYGMQKEMAGGGLLASQTCMDGDITNVDLDALRAELGALPKPEEDYKTKYGFLF